MDGIYRIERIRTHFENPSRQSCKSRPLSSPVEAAPPNGRVKVGPGVSLLCRWTFQRLRLDNPWLF